MINLSKSTEICYFYQKVNLIEEIRHFYPSWRDFSNFTGKSRPAKTLSCPAKMIRDPYNRAIIIHECDFYHEIRDFLCDSINGRDIAYSYSRGII